MSGIGLGIWITELAHPMKRERENPKRVNRKRYFLNMLFLASLGQE
jgi:hypothetical protein